MGPIYTLLRDDVGHLIPSFPTNQQHKVSGMLFGNATSAAALAAAALLRGFAQQSRPERKKEMLFYAATPPGAHAAVGSPLCIRSYVCMYIQI